ncbi:MAG: Gfo/Idh/MocA family oxidoreductase [Candidatus Pacebacteria bacterium]|jgi:predicted dehydrogenase|nr:Gfo/Idh/MocA family oxidoreductase [Candidatus Paceibacterota bacterium]MBT4652337.1 Gfo/Idh/MocA family oxidoreductase [Candidatus Paceibacterota bacterium]MBT6756164.1 Gfo/Idh/MocA family oxidoreductase [Candidatus Paceibacterota bacterium]MBT6921731.1 Gfo/Idh/MocA family oxidoreductase [Candidatus Paceibacterota bacterium]
MSSKNKTLNIMLIGIGPHAKRIYLPFLKKHQKRLNLKLSIAIDIKESEKKLIDYFKKNDLPIEILDFVPLFNGAMPQIIEKKLNTIIKKNQINTLIISTPPTAHKQYALWGLKNNLDILMDKPISIYKKAITSIEQSKKIYQDYNELLNAYKNSKSTFIINSQRRYHPGKKKAYQLIEKIAKEFGVPVTNIHSYDADGQWRLPGEILNESYHGYNEGMGKVSHSGYHYFDSLYKFYMAGVTKGKKADSVRLFSSFLTPRGHIKQIQKKDFRKIFQNEKYNPEYSDQEFYKLFKNFGEIDFSALIIFLQKNDVICNSSIDMIHNSYCGRSWVKPNTDLYKHNGRIKHEHHVIQQGPLQTIQIHGYQMNDNHDKNTKNDFELGGNNHYEIHVYRNTGICGGKPLTIYSTRSFDKNRIEIDSNVPVNQLTYEYSRELVVEEFFEILRDKRKKSISSFEDHYFPARVMSALYESHITKQPVEFSFGGNN